MQDDGPAALLAGRAPIGGYGRGVFRTGGVTHHGSLLILPEGGTLSWPVASMADLTRDSLAAVLQLGKPAGFLLLGTGETQIFPDPALRQTFAAAGIGLEAMDTGAACRTYNVLLGEERVFAAALIALPA